MIYFQSNLESKNWSYTVLSIALHCTNSHMEVQTSYEIRKNRLAGKISLLLVGCKFSSLEALIVEGQIWLLAATLDLKTKLTNIVFINRMMSSSCQLRYCWKPRHKAHIVFENLQNS